MSPFEAPGVGVGPAATSSETPAVVRALRGGFVWLSGGVRSH